MTGYGASQKEDGKFAVEVVIQSFNSKGLDIRENTPREFGENILAWRKLISSKLKRGRIELLVHYRFSDIGANFQVQESSFMQYYNYLTALANKVGAQTDTFVQAVNFSFKTSPMVSLTPSHKQMADEAVQEAIGRVLQTRADEGGHLAVQLENAVQSIGKNLEAVVATVPLRTERLRKRLEDKIEDREGALDSHRWEQEMLYYLEKMDIEEECVRLKGHLNYFLSTMQKHPPIGKELVFILEEMRRELNAIGSKAQVISLQHRAVEMKKTLEQMKEQLANVL